MPFLNNIVNSLNDLLAPAFGLPLADIKMYGVTEVMIEPSTDDDGKNITVRYPSVIDADGEVTKIDIDDAYSIIMYHKVDGIVNTIDAKSGYGTSRGDISELVNMSLLLFAFRRKTRKEAWWFEAVIKDILPETLNATDKQNHQLQRSILKPGNSTYDKLFLLQREYTLVQLNYPDLMAMELKYQVQSTWRKGCFIACGCNDASSPNYIITENGQTITTETDSPLVTEN